jgi:hypothetical protein
VLSHGIGTAFLLAAILDVACLLVILLVIRIKQAAPASVPAREAEQEAIAS